LSPSVKVVVTGCSARGVNTIASSSAGDRRRRSGQRVAAVAAAQALDAPSASVQPPASVIDSVSVAPLLAIRDLGRPIRWSAYTRA